MEHGQAGKAEAENRSGDSHTGGQDNLGDPAVCGVVSRFPILAGLTCLLIPPGEEYPVVRSSRHPDGYQQTNGEGSKTKNLVIAEERDDSSGHLQFYPDHQQQKNDGDNRTVDEEQRNEDHREAHRLNCDDTLVAALAQIRNERRGAGDIRLDPRRRSRPPDDVPDGFGRFVRQGRGRPTGEVHLNICGLTIGALRGARREGIRPEILDVLHMLWIVLQLTNQPIVVLVSSIAEGLLTLQDDHRRSLGIRFLEVLTHALHRLERRRILGTQRY